MKKYNAKQLRIGTRVEMEHTTDKRIARKIAKDHLNEFPNYYTALVKMEKTLAKKRTRQLKKAGYSF